jgi:TRAP-type uncharacterized transport system substrate-binding protein
MRRWRAAAALAIAVILGTLVIAGLLQFLAPDAAYHVADRGRELFSGRRVYKIGLGATTGAGSEVARVLNGLLRERSGYELELVNRPNSTTGSLLGEADGFDLVMTNSGIDDLLSREGVYALAALEPQHFFVIVPNDSPVQEFRDLTGRVNPGVRDSGRPPTLGERVLEYYGLIAPGDGVDPQRPVTVVRPKAGTNLADFESGHNVAATRTQSPHSQLIEGIMNGGGYRLVPIRDHEALAKAIPGTSPSFIPAGLYGPKRRIPAEPVPTISVMMLLVARERVPGRVVRDILEALYDPRFAREMQYDISEDTGRNSGGLRLHPAAEIYYHRNDLVTSDRLGRLSFVGSAFVAIAAAVQFLFRFRRNERVKHRRQLLGDDLTRLDAIRRQLEEAESPAAARQLLRDADDLLAGAEQDAAADLLDADGIDSVRSLHQLCMHAAARRLTASASAG